MNIFLGWRTGGMRGGRSIVLALAGLLLWSAPTASASSVPGERHRVLPEELPAPSEQSSPFNPPDVVPRPEGAMPRAPAGFTVSLFADRLEHPRSMALAPDGSVLLAESDAGRVMILRDTDGDGRADRRAILARGLNRPHGLAVRPDGVYVADQLAVWRLPPLGSADRSGERVPLTPLGALGGVGGYWTRSLVFAPDGRHFYVAIGSRRNVAEDPLPRASIQRFDADGSNPVTFASGLRNPVGLAFHPETDRLFTTVCERDRMGDGLVPDYLTELGEGDFFGWPYAYIGPNPDPDFGALAPEAVERTRSPDLLFEAHSTPTSLVFHDREGFPRAWRGDAFVALRGSWNAAQPRGYEVVRVPFENGRPAGGYETFLTGFTEGAGDASGSGRARLWGRPAGLLVLADGSLLVADDTARVIWRVSYSGTE